MQVLWFAFKTLEFHCETFFKRVFIWTFTIYNVAWKTIRLYRYIVKEYIDKVI